MAFSISPKHTTDDFPSGLTLNDKIEVFIARVQGWQLGPAREMIDRHVSHRGFALLSILISYFEMVGKYISGFTERGQSPHYFKKGLMHAFPDIDIPQSQAFLDMFYERVRNGLYHVGITRANVLLSGDIPTAIGFHPEKQLIAINPDLLVDALHAHFLHLASLLRDPLNAELRELFQTRFDYDNQ